jgi:hypothetical protein
MDGSPNVPTGADVPYIGDSAFNCTSYVANASDGILPYVNPALIPGSYAATTGQAEAGSGHPACFIALPIVRATASSCLL